MKRGNYIFFVFTNKKNKNLLTNVNSAAYWKTQCPTQNTFIPVPRSNVTFFIVCINWLIIYTNKQVRWRIRK